MSLWPQGDNSCAPLGKEDDIKSPLLRRRASTDPDTTIELFSDSRFNNQRTWFGDLSFALKRYTYGGFLGRPTQFPDMSLHEQRLVESVTEAEACESGSSSGDEAAADEEAQPRGGSSSSSKNAQPTERYSALTILKRLASKPTLLAIRFLGWALSKIFRSAFTAVHIHNSHVVAEAVKQVDLANNSSNDKRKKKTALILLPTHRSHADYLLLSFIFFGLNLPVPTIAAGDNLNVPLLGKLLSGAGAFFIRRANQSPRYRLVLQGYLFLLCKSGIPVEFFIEGGRSRRGCIGRPKVGLLSLIIQMVRDGDLHDAVLLPLSIDYDRVPEGNGFANEVLGTGKKKPESLLGTLRALVEWMIWGKKEGAVYVGFCDAPLSVRDFITANNNSSPKQTNEDGHHPHHHSKIGGTIFSGGSTANLVLAQDNALAHEVGRVVVDCQRDCALVGSGALAACAMLMRREKSGEMAISGVETRALALHSLLLRLGYGHRIPPVVPDQFATTVDILLRASSKKTCEKTTRICLRYAAAPVVIRLLPVCALALGGGDLLHSWLAGMYDIEKPAAAPIKLAVVELDSEQRRDLAELIAPVVFILEAALLCLASRDNWRLGETKAEVDVVAQVREKLAMAPFPELSAPLEISAAFRACVIHGVLKRTNIKKGKDTLAAYTLTGTDLIQLELGLRELAQARAVLDTLVDSF